MTAVRDGGKWWTLGAMSFALFMIMLDNTIVNVALPSIQRSLDATPTALQWTVDAYVLAFAVLIILGGKLGDRFGRKRLFLIGLVVFTAMSAACALAPDDSWLIAFRAAQGAGAALMNPLSLSIIVDAFDRRQLGTAIGVWAGVSALGLAVGPVLGGVLTEHVDWSAVFWINVPIGILAAIITALVVRESRDPSTRALDLPGTALVTAGLFALVFGLIETTNHSWTSPLILAALSAAAILLVAFVAWETRTPEPMLPLRFFRERAFATSALTVAFVGLALFGVIYFITLYMQNVKGWSPTEAGLRSLPLTLMIMIVGPQAGRLLTALGPRLVMSAGMVLTTAGLLGLAQIGVGSSYNAIWPFYVLVGVGVALTMPATATTAMSAVESEKAGIASGVVNASRQVGAAIGIAVLGSIVSTIATSRWDDAIAGNPAAAQLRSGEVTDLVVGGRGDTLAQIAGPAVRQPALESFVHGVTWAMWVGAGLTLAAALTAFIGLRGTRPQRAEQRVAVEM